MLSVRLCLMHQQQQLLQCPAAAAAAVTVAQDRLQMAKIVLKLMQRLLAQLQVHSHLRSS
jgi:hypothetical protein